MTASTMTSYLPVLVRRAALLAAVLLTSACAQLKADLNPDESNYTWVVATPDRTDADRVNDQRRQPEKLLQFYGVRPGMRVLDMGATGGYNTELLARVVGASGVVYAQNSPALLQNIVKGRLDERMKRAAMANVVPLAREFDDPVPADVRNLDLVTFNFIYHDTVGMGVDRAKMNRAVFDALKRGGTYIVADHSAKPGAGVDVAKTLHRIEESVVRREVEAAGFKFVAVADFLRNPADPRDTPVFKNPVKNDEFVLKFVKP
jgi:predicted methyltransferase